MTRFQRDESLANFSSVEYDVVVVGAGMTGAGVALDAASRGLRVALVDAGDIASGTSSKSSKMVHGRRRYLQQKEFLLVYENLRERQRLLENTPLLGWNPDEIASQVATYEALVTSEFAMAGATVEQS